MTTGPGGPDRPTSGDGAETRVFPAAGETAPIGWPARGGEARRPEPAPRSEPTARAEPPRRAAAPPVRERGAPGGRSAPSRTPRRAQLALRRIDPWSVFKFMLLFSVCMLVVSLVAVTTLYVVLDAMGVFDSVNEAINDLADLDEDGSTVGDVFNGRRIIGGAAVIGSINALLGTALATLGAFIYNLCADLSGGIEVTLAERD